MAHLKIPPQHQARQPGIEAQMRPKPRHVHPEHRPSGMLRGRTILITGGDSGIGRAVAVDESQDAQETKAAIEANGRKCLTFAGDIAEVRNWLIIRQPKERLSHSRVRSRSRSSRKVSA